MRKDSGAMSTTFHHWQCGQRLRTVRHSNFNFPRVISGWLSLNQLWEIISIRIEKWADEIGFDFRFIQLSDNLFSWRIFKNYLIIETKELALRKRSEFELRQWHSRFGCESYFDFHALLDVTLQAIVSFGSVAFGTAAAAVRQTESRYTVFILNENKRYRLK